MSNPFSELYKDDGLYSDIPMSDHPYLRSCFYRRVVSMYLCARPCSCRHPIFLRSISSGAFSFQRGPGNFALSILSFKDCHLAISRFEFELRATLMCLSDISSHVSVLCVYEGALLANESLLEHVLCLTRDEFHSNSGSYPSVLVGSNRGDAKALASLLRELLALFHVETLRDCEFLHKPGKEPLHMLFLYLTQLLALYVSAC
ncbi:hypothetical protein XENOCAPTIV_030746 [Xenoophorus captivus]|uniref:Uncharacterized protein n=1 Tax=Xenoophorus captivus TaxID=1517983 RepID=A0ABV0S424_9TELE